MTRVTRRYQFAASHRLHNRDLTAEENQRLYGKCNNPYGHGHDYVLEVSVNGPVDGESGLILPVPALDRLVESEVLARFANKNLNLDLPEFAAKVPTTENLAIEIGRRLAGAWSHRFPRSAARLERVRIQETGKNSFELIFNRQKEEDEEQ